MAENPMHDMLIAELRDVEVPEPPGFWPPAPGWWGLGLACVVAAFLIYRAFAARRKRTAYRREAYATLQAIHEEFEREGDPRAYARSAAELARRVAIETLGRERAARPSGAEFVALLDQISDAALSKECARILAETAYRPSVEFDVDRLHAELDAWVRALVRPEHA